MTVLAAPPRPILNLPVDVWEQTPSLVQELLTGFHQQVRQLAAAP